jgi:excisionase family DNA binding protein
MTERVTYTVPEVAQRFGIHEDTVRAAIKRGEIRATRLGRQWLIGIAEIERIARSDG